MKRSQRIVYFGAIIAAVALTALLWFAGDANAATYNRTEDVVRNTSGKTVSGASVSVYIADTDSLADLYADKEGSTRKANPTFTDSAGRYFFYAAPGLYDVTVSRSGISTYTVQDVRVYPGEWFTYNVLDYGAIPDDALDDYQSIAAAVADARAAGYGRVLLPTGIYRISQPIVVESNNITIYGDGVGATVLTPLTTLLGINGIVLDTVENCSVSDMTIAAFARTGSAKAYGVKVVAGYNNTVSDCAFIGCDHAGVSFQHDSDIYGALSDSASITMNKENSFDGGYHIARGNRFEYSPEGVGVEVMRSDRCIIEGNSFRGNTLWDVRIVGSIGTLVSGNRMNGSTAGVVVQGYGDPAPVGTTKYSKRTDVIGNSIEASFGVKLYSGAFDCAVIGNNITATNDTAGVCVDIAHTGDILNGENAVGDILVSGNLMNGGAVGVVYTAEGYGVNIRGNTIADYDWMGVYASAADSGDTLRGFVVEGNTIRPGWNPPSRTVKLGLSLAGALLSGRAGGNTFDTFGYTGTWTEKSSTSSVILATIQPVQSAAAPDTVGQRGLMWFDKTNSKMKVYTGSAWVDLH